MIEKDFGVSGRMVGDIDIMDSYSFISVPLREAEVIMDAFHAMKKKGKFAPVKVERAQHNKKRREPASRGRKKPFGKSQKKKKW
jgi:ATP-dependent RNA helicase DeaD